MGKGRIPRDTKSIETSMILNAVNLNVMFCTVVSRGKMENCWCFDSICFKLIMLRMLKLEIRHRTLRTENSYHKHANNNKKQTLSWSSFVARVVHLTFLDDSDSKSPNEGRHRLKLIEFVFSSATFDIMISATKSAPSKRSSRLQPICIRHLNTAPGTNFWRNIDWAISYKK